MTRRDAAAALLDVPALDDVVADFPLARIDQNAVQCPDRLVRGADEHRALESAGRRFDVSGVEVLQRFDRFHGRTIRNGRAMAEACGTP